MSRRQPANTKRALFAATSVGFVAVFALHAVSPAGRKVALPTTTTTTPGSTQTTGPTTTVSGATRSAVGASEQFGYGTISVKVTVQGSQILAVSVANIQTLESYSQSLAQQVDPMLISEAMSAQSANIQSVSGASYTCAGFAQSLQSALSQLGI
jgi:uncharacterized protein with FMN-binding domain